VRQLSLVTMFATPQSYCVTPTASATSGNNFMRLQHRASLIIKDVKRRSMRTCKRKRIERTLSGTFDSTIESISMDPKCSPMRGSYSEISSHEFTPLSKNRSPQVPASYGHSSLAAPPLAGRKLHLPPVLPFEAALELNSLASSDEENCEDKENINISKENVNISAHKAETDTASLTPFYSSRLRRRCSSFFTPKSRRSVLQGSKIAQSESLKKRIDEKIAGEGRLIPLKQGYMFKKSRSSGLFKRKYVILCSDSLMTYYPSFQAYIDNMDGKEIQLGHVTVKIPGRKPSGIRTLCETVQNDKEDLTEELCLQGETVKEVNESRTLPSSTLKRKRLSIEQSVHELSLVSLCGAQWHFQLCSSEELSSWESCIKTLENIGNTKANAYWEHNMGPGVKPGPKSSIGERERFIQSKYVNKAFIAQTKAEVEKLI